MNVCITSYKKEYRPLIEEFIEDEFVKSDIINCLDKYYDYGILALEDNIPIAIGVFTGATSKTSVTLYVKKSKRNLGVGSKLLNALETKMKVSGVEEIVSDYKVNVVEQNFMRKRGYKYWFKSNFMTYTGDKNNIEYHDIIHYQDKYYNEVQRILSTSFHKMRLEVGLKSVESMQSQEERKWFNESAENIFIIYRDSKILGVSIIDGNELDSVAIDINEQGKGYGRTLISYSINKILERNHSNINIWVVEGNPAKYLYKKIGFETKRIHEFVCKNISPN